MKDKDIYMTDAAVEKVKSSMTQEAAEQGFKGVRISVVGAGCSGFSYNWELTKEINETDHVVDYEGTLFIIDDVSRSHMDGVTIDYKKEGLTENFVFDNPNAIHCGCGTSFTLKDS